MKLTICTHFLAATAAGMADRAACVSLPPKPPPVNLIKTEIKLSCTGKVELTKTKESSCVHLFILVHKKI